LPRKIRQLIRDLEKAGLVNEGGKGSHRNLKHSRAIEGVTLPGQPADYAKPYQEEAVKTALEQLKNG
jgi:predicted RNA binding protein YcfA (HicA-like mRNA interferase family)